MRHFLVRYSIRKGLGPDWKSKESEISFDDIEPGTTDDELKCMARNQVDSRLRNTEDYPIYGENWIIEEIEEVYY